MCLADKYQQFLKTRSQVGHFWLLEIDVWDRNLSAPGTVHRSFVFPISVFRCLLLLPSQVIKGLFRKIVIFFFLVICCSQFWVVGKGEEIHVSCWKPCRTSPVGCTHWIVSNWQGLLSWTFYAVLTRVYYM